MHSPCISAPVFLKKFAARAAGCPCPTPHPSAPPSAKLPCQNWDWSGTGDWGGGLGTGDWGGGLGWMDGGLGGWRSMSLTSLITEIDYRLLDI